MSATSSPDRSDGPILIAGGGVAGLSLAIALDQAGLACHVLEGQTSFSEAGAGIQLGPNGTRLLSRLGVADLLKASRCAPSALVVSDAISGRQLSRMPLGSAMEQRHGAPYWVTHRRDLQAALLARACQSPRITLETGFRLASIVEHETGVEAVAEDGARRQGWMLAGADGLWSVARGYVAPGVTHPYSGKTAARAIMPLNPSMAGALATTVGLSLGPKIHVVHYPIEAGRSLAVVVIRDRDWPGEGWGHGIDAGLIQQAVAGVAPELRNLIASFADWREWPLYAPSPLPAWSKGRVTVLGDAAHPPLPFLAQGGVMAIEDAVVLAGELARDGGDVRSMSGLSRALARYEVARLARTTRVQQASARNGRIYHLNGPLAMARNLALSAVPGARVLAGYDWLYGWQPPV